MTDSVAIYGTVITKVILTSVFIAAGSVKLAGFEKMVIVFDEIGFGQWFRYLTGAIEILSALMLLSQKTSIYGYAFLLCTMVCAILIHIFIIGGSFVPAMILLLLIVINMVMPENPDTF